MESRAQPAHSLPVIDWALQWISLLPALLKKTLHLQRGTQAGEGKDKEYEKVQSMKTFWIKDYYYYFAWDCFITSLFIWLFSFILISCCNDEHPSIFFTTYPN